MFLYSRPQRGGALESKPLDLDNSRRVTSYGPWSKEECMDVITSTLVRILLPWYLVLDLRSEVRVLCGGTDVAYSRGPCNFR